LQYRISFRRVSVNGDTLKISPDLIPLFSRPVRVGTVSGTHILDRRDDPGETRRGFYNTLDYGLATKYLGSEKTYSRLLWKNSTYHPVSRQVIFARSSTIGWIHGFGTKPDEVDVPLPERFFGGGATTHRGFPENQAGPRDLITGFPVGGKATIFNSME